MGMRVSWAVPVIVSILILGAVSLGTAAYADDRNPPDYRGTLNSLQFEWGHPDFPSVLPVPIPPQVFVQGPSIFDLVDLSGISQGGTTPIPPQGFAACTFTQCSIAIPNFVDDLERKFIRIQVTYDPTFSPPPGSIDFALVDLDTQTPAECTLIVRQVSGLPEVPAASDYYFEDWECLPNPSVEFYTIGTPSGGFPCGFPFGPCSDPDPIFLRQVVIDTVSFDGDAPPAIPTPDHYLGYKAEETEDTEFIQRLVHLADQFVTGIFNVKEPKMLFNPVEKHFGGEEFLISDPATHLKAYEIEEIERRDNILVENQFGQIIVSTTEAELLLVPTTKSHEDPDVPELGNPFADHYKCYKVDQFDQFSTIQVTLFDLNFGAEKLFDVKEPKLLCNPVDKNGEGIRNTENHLLCYDVEPADEFEKNKKISVFTNNQFGPEQLDVEEEKQFCVPSTKTLL